MRTLEFWPDYGGRLLHEGGAPVALDSADLGLSPHLITRAARWLGTYDDALLDPTKGDAAWISEGRTLFELMSSALRERGIELTDWEGYWGR